MCSRNGKCFAKRAIALIAFFALWIAAAQADAQNGLTVSPDEPVNEISPLGADVELRLLHLKTSGQRRASNV